MKKLLFIIVAMVVAFLLYINVNASQIIIPADSIRFRVVANSNTIQDQVMKIKVKDYIDSHLALKMLDVNDVNEANLVIENEIEVISKEISNIFKENNYDKDFVVNYGKNFFPDKLYKGVKYSGGSYDSLVVTIGDGDGDNWWCVLFPPLCLLEVEESELGDVEYEFFVKKIINGLFE